jgi:hypothetical protein
MHVLVNTALALSEMCRVLVLCAAGEVHSLLNLMFLSFFIMKDKGRGN